MHPILNTMISRYEKTNDIKNIKNIIKQIIQEIALSGLSRSNFFNYAAFNGGTSLRIFYNLNRFSEDLDFSLIENTKNFDLQKYKSYIDNEFLSFNLPCSLVIDSQDNDVKRAYIVGNFKDILLTFEFDSTLLDKIISNELIRIKLEIDTSDIKDGTTEYKYLLLPYPSSIRIYDLPSLFAGKLHAIISRNWKNRVKGRDYFDYLFYISINSKVNYNNLKNRLVHSSTIDFKDELNEDKLKELLISRFTNVDFNIVKDDVLNFISDINQVNNWSKDLFISITKNYHF